MKRSELRKIIKEEFRKILLEKNIKSQKWNKLQSWETTPKGVPGTVKVKGGNYVTGYLDGNTLHISGANDKMIKKQVKSTMEADSILFDLEDKKGKI